MDVRTLLRRSAQFNADRIAVVDGDRRLTFGEMWDRGIRLANGLLAEGIKPQDHVAVLEDNSLAAADFYLAAAAGNLCRVPLYARNRSESHFRMLRNTNTRAILVDEARVHELDGVEAAVPGLGKIIVRDSKYESWLADQSDVDPDPPVGPDDLFIIRHTGGTSGSPLAAAFTHQQWWRGARDWFYLFPPPEPADAILHVGSIAHASGYTFLPIWVAGGIQVMTAGLSAEQIVDTMEKERIAYVFMPPTLLNMVARIPSVRDRDMSSLKVLFVGAGPVSEGTIQLARDAFGDEKLWQLYGGTEAVPTAAMGPKEWFSDVEGSKPLLAAGRVCAWAQIDIRDESGRSVGVDEIGEVWVRSDAAIDGYYNAPEETSSRVVDGWVATGDLGRLDRNGYLYLVDRKNEVIVSGGLNIYPGEIENAIAAHPAVVEVAVFGVPHEKWGETPMAVCSVDPGIAVTESEIISLVADQLGSHKKPSGVVLQTEALPRSPVGKLLRRVLREPYWAGRQQRVAGA